MTDRVSADAFSLQIQPTAIFPSGTISQNVRQASVNTYAGILADNPIPQTATSYTSRMRGASSHIRQDP